ncbi:MAG: hypothetical protein J5J00_13890 [Deltaproteobacteria bacterium]|nr:hypothetical protein [Deltaproteobacteria bacterium]
MPKSKKFSYKHVVNYFSGVTEFKGLELEESTARYIADRLNRMHELEERMNELLMHYGATDSPIKVRIGPELEFYNIAGEQSFSNRLRQLARANDADDLGAIFEARLAKDDSFMPRAAQLPSLDAAFRTKLRLEHRVRVKQEPAYNTQIATERCFSLDGMESTISRIALFQHEIVSPPRNPYGLGVWLSTIGQRIIDRAPDYGLKRAEIITSLHDMSSSSLHFHISLAAGRGGETINLMQRDAFSNERGRRQRNPAEPSQLALHIAHAMNEVLKDYIYILAPTDDAYERFSDRHFVGTSFIGFSPRKARFHMGSAMFRGEGRETFRVEDPGGTPDEGALRIELRAADVGCIGHPNKRAYRDQLMAPFDVTETLMYILYKGVENWAGDRAAELQGHKVAIKSEEGLYEQRFKLPPRAGTAATYLKSAQKRGDGFLTPSRAEIITARGLRQQEINGLDHKPNLPRGQHHDRTPYLSP